MGHPGANVIPCVWCSSHLGSSFELLAQRSFGIREKTGTEGENCPALIHCKKLGQKIVSVPLGKIKKLGWQRAGARGDDIAGLSFHSQTSVK